MNDAAFIRDRIVRLLKSEKDFRGMVSAETDAYISAAADVVVPCDDGDCDIYRITIVPHDIRKRIK